MSNPRQNYLRNYRYFGRDITNFERSSSRSIRRLKNPKKQQEKQHLNNYAEKLRKRYNLGSRKNTTAVMNQYLNKTSRNPKSLTITSRRASSSRYFERSKYLNPKISKFNLRSKEKISKSRRYFIPKQMGRAGLEENQKGKSLNMNLMRSKNLSNSCLSRHRSREKGKNYKKVEKLLSEYILKSRKNLKEKSPRNFYLENNRSNERVSLLRSSNQCDKNICKNDFRKTPNHQINCEKNNISSILEGYVSRRKSQKNLKESILGKKIVELRLSREKKGISKIEGFKIPNLLDSIDTSEEETECIKENFSRNLPKKIQFEREKILQKLRNDEPGFDFSQMKNLHMPNVWNYLVSKKVKKNLIFFSGCEYSFS